MTGDPPAIITRERLVGRAGKTRTFTQKIAVPDQELFRRVREHAAKGDEIEITTVTDWTAAELATVLLDFRRRTGSGGHHRAHRLAEDDEWKERWDRVIADIRQGVPKDVTPEEIESDITVALEELRRERRRERRARSLSRECCAVGQQEEIPLYGGTHGPVVRVGDTVRRAIRPSTPAVQSLLRHLERADFEGAPRALGLDERGREVLTFIPGEVAVRVGDAPLPDYVRSSETLVSVARLLRRMHDATVGFVPPPDAMWSFQVGASREGEVICHNDLGPWNTVFVDGRPVAFIDWDGATPGPREWDIAYAMYRCVPFIPDDICTLIGWPEPPDRQARLRLFCDTYGLDDRSQIMAIMVQRIQAMIDTGVAGHAAGDPKFGDLWMSVMRLRLIRDREFVRAQADGVIR